MTERTTRDKSQQFTRKKIQCYSYGLNDEIGKGYSSKVYKGRNDDNTQPVAVKVIDLKQLKNQINRTLLDSQIDILKELKDIPNILCLHDVYTTKNNTYLVTQLCQSDLSKKIKQRPKEEEVYRYMQQIIKGYLEFQKRSIVHRDLKPANLLMTDDGAIKIADFGFGIRTSQLAKANRYNVGSPLYMAPESLKKNDYSFKSDIWALGVIFYEMLLNDTPWRARSQKDLLKKIQTEPIQNIISTKNIGAAAKEFLVRTLKIDRSRRMGPEELATFSFDAGGNVLAQRNMNCASKSVFKYESIIITSPTCNLKGKIDKSVEKPFPSAQSKSKSISKGLVANQSVNCFQLQPVNHSLQSPSLLQQRTGRLNTMTEAKTRQNRKLISKILISQVHFCRFLFKLMQKMKQSSKIGLLSQLPGQIYEDLMKNYTSIIHHKVNQLNSFQTNNYINCEGYVEYKTTSDFQKLMKIGREYNDRYKTQLQKYWDEEYCLTAEPTNNMVKELYEAIEGVTDKMTNPQEQICMMSKDIVILDYLITSHQLIEMLKSSPTGYQRFARKSRIEEIVEGKTVDIHLGLYRQIMQRVRQIMQKRQFASFGGHQQGQIMLAV